MGHLLRVRSRRVRLAGRSGLGGDSERLDREGLVVTVHALAGLGAPQPALSSSSGMRHFCGSFEACGPGSRSLASQASRTSSALVAVGSLWTLLLIVGLPFSLFDGVGRAHRLSSSARALAARRRGPNASAPRADRWSRSQRLVVTSVGIAAAGLLLEGLFRMSRSLGPLLVGCVVVLDTQGEGDLPLRRARRRILHHASGLVVSPAPARARRGRLPSHGKRRCRNPPRPVLAVRRGIRLGTRGDPRRARAPLDPLAVRARCSSSRLESAGDSRSPRPISSSTSSSSSPQFSSSSGCSTGAVEARHRDHAHVRHGAHETRGACSWQQSSLGAALLASDPDVALDVAVARRRRGCDRRARGSLAHLVRRPWNRGGEDPASGLDPTENTERLWPSLRLAFDVLFSSDYWSVIVPVAVGALAPRRPCAGVSRSQSSSERSSSSSRWAEAGSPGQSPSCPSRRSLVRIRSCASWAPRALLCAAAAPAAPGGCLVGRHDARRAGTS